MPIYEYRCSDCNEVFDAYKRLSEDKAHETCPSCSGRGEKIGISLFSTKSSRSGSSSCGPKGSPFG